ncbi:myo-inositol-1(or 4)-monophosphatase [Humitalea rosea]|uniref:Inositol-1-monophosphatase n=1 Tax=Humitalea rosea TaxID=990373 RepID=A0A2W7IRU2_9PROT|nr:myo-inositol-1(or 4)-monophosphatase [Humitalea rosea]
MAEDEAPKPEAPAPAGTLRARPGTVRPPMPAGPVRPDAPPPTRPRRPRLERGEGAPAPEPLHRTTAVGGGSSRLSPALTVVVAAVRKAGKALLKDFGEVENLQVSMKGPGDFVSQADLKAEKTLRAELARARPNFGFLMEESGLSGNEDWEYRWVVDPLDGTTNFLHGIPHWAISVAVEKRGNDRTPDEVVAGVIYNPAADELFWAEKGGGAFLNDRRLRVSGRRQMIDALFATGIPFASVPRKAEFSSILARLMPQVSGVRRFGAAALDLAWVAAGRYDGFWELGLNKWDIGAGLLMVKEAGGFVSDPEGGDAWTDGHVVAGNPILQPQLRAVVSEGIAAVAAARGRTGA